MSADPGAFEVALCQYEFAGVESVDALCRRVERLFERAGEADCYVLPELFASDCRPVDDGPATLDADRRAALHGALADAADDREAVVVGGSYNAVEDGSVYNRCPVATPGAGVKTYDKRHLVPEEREAGKRAGEAPPPVVEHRGVGVGVAVCYDVEFPELVRDLADRGAEVVAVPSWTSEEAGYQRVRRCAAARAVENQLYVAQVSVVGGRSADLRGTGRSAVYAPCDDVVGARGTRLSLPRDEFAAGTCSVDVRAVRRSRSGASVRPYSDAKRGEE